ncbi:hypothetical protein LRR80_04540 [Streptomyces sp. RO-S4]|nr:hypothetical protein [Streptomyces sp. RO-S4]
MACCSEVCALSSSWVTTAHEGRRPGVRERYACSTRSLSRRTSVDGAWWPGDGMEMCRARGDSWSCDRTSETHRFTTGLCPAHYAQHRRAGRMRPIDAARAVTERRMCEFDACGKAVSAKGLCRGHYQQHRDGRPLTPLRRKRRTGAVRAMMERGVIECLGCGEHKVLSEYSVLNGSGAPRPYCKPCNAERVRLGHYSVTKEFIEALLLLQEGRCAVCRAAGSGRRALDIDHDHGCCPGRRSCGECVRGLVCSSCNFHALGWYEALPPELRSFNLLNGYLADPPAKRLRMRLTAAVGD